MRRPPARRVGCRTGLPLLQAADDLRSGAAARRPHSRCRRAQWPASGRSFADYLRLAHIAYPKRGDDVIAEIRGMADGIEGLDVHLLSDDFDAHLIVSGRARDRARFDAEALAQQFDAAPCR